jgi:hypothetical protein
MNKIVIILLLCLNLTYALSMDLDRIALECKTDKSSAWHNYTPVYDKQFAHLQHKPIKFLEIGFCKGASAHMWDQYFTAATKLHFLDIDPTAYNYVQGLSARCELDMVDQSNINALNQFIAKVGGEFDIIIDDGGHTMHQQITSFRVLFPQLKSKGIYVIEDLHTSYWHQYGGQGSLENPQAGPGTTIKFLYQLIDDLNYIGARTQCADKRKCPTNILATLNYYQQHIEAMFFYDSLCFIIKR